METAPRTPASRPNLVSVGTIIWLSSELMFFAALFAMYFTVRSVTKGSSLPWPGAHLNLTLGSINTTVLLLSSVTCQMGVCRQAKDEIYNCPPALLIVGRADDGWLATWSRADAVVSHPIDPIALAQELAGLMRERPAVSS